MKRGVRGVIDAMKARRILELAGSGAWKGDLAEMRKDPPRRPNRRRRSVRRSI